MRSLTGVEREEYSPTLLTPINAAVSRLVPDSVRVGLGTFLLGIFCWRALKPREGVHSKKVHLNKTFKTLFNHTCTLLFPWICHSNKYNTC